MQDSRTPPFSENAYSSSVSRRKKKSSAGKQPLSQFPVNDDAQPSRNKASKRNHRQPEIPNSDSLPGDEYRALRRRYLLLEEESSVLENELKAVEVEVKALEDDKLHLLDQLVVLEGLVDPSGP
ncbi:PREDICTED: uncharacterized protein LOC109117268 [Tarenaya hassleriana]|uniref:uncharacterized protein LOC109117268 n=1 Tax=Tarenaya hassleriana TaxID=28532 RepID=UPI0008FCF074|nr:PREDICTED: uncharacterized protein LOC109117268 [Tarenaya hassleriana]